jgi:ribosome maturation factor RimP
MPNSKSVLLEQIEQLVSPALIDAGMELVDLEFAHEHGRWVLRFFLDKAGGITLDDCAKMSDRCGGLLDAADIIKQSYSLEVSSPGINRPIKKEADYARFRGERVEVTMYAPLNGRRNFRGTIDSVEPGVVTIDSLGEKFSLPIADVAKAKLDPEIKI